MHNYASTSNYDECTTTPRPPLCHVLLYSILLYILVQVHNYASTSPPLCRLMADPDRLAVQLAAAVLPPDTVLASLFVASGDLLLEE